MAEEGVSGADEFQHLSNDNESASGTSNGNESPRSARPRATDDVHSLNVSSGGDELRDGGGGGGVVVNGTGNAHVGEDGADTDGDKKEGPLFNVIDGKLVYRRGPKKGKDAEDTAKAMFVQRTRSAFNTAERLVTDFGEALDVELAIVWIRRKNIDDPGLTYGTRLSKGIVNDPNVRKVTDALLSVMMNKKDTEKAVEVAVKVRLAAGLHL